MKVLSYEEVLKQAKQLHYELWDWLSHHPSKDKEDWPRWKRRGGDVPGVSSYCFACFVSENKRGGACLACSCDWGSGRLCEDYGSPFHKWDLAKTPRTRKKYALLVRDAWREE